MIHRYRFISEHHTRYGVARLCRVLAAKRRQGYYEWLAAQPARQARAQAEDELAAQIRAIHAEHRGCYGSPRIVDELRRRGRPVNRKRIERIMRERGIVGVTRRRRRSLTRPDAAAAPVPDLIGRDFMTWLAGRMTVDGHDVAARIRTTFDRVVGQGLRSTAYQGAADDQIDEMARSQGVSVVPVAVRQALRLVGGGAGLWLAGSSFGAGAVGLAEKQAAVGQLSRSGSPLRDARGLLVLVAHQGHSYHVIDGADQSQPDPAVWLVEEGERVDRRWPGVTMWFDSVSPDVQRYRERLALLLESDPDFIPGWATHIEP